MVPLAPGLIDCGPSSTEGLAGTVLDGEATALRDLVPPLPSPRDCGVASTDCWAGATGGATTGGAGGFVARGLFACVMTFTCGLTGVEATASITAKVTSSFSSNSACRCFPI